MTEYDSWLLSQADDYMSSGPVERVYLTGRSLFDVECTSDSGEVKTFSNVPLIYYQSIDTADEDEDTGRCSYPSWDDIYDWDKRDYFSFDVDYFEPDEPEHGETDIGDYRLTKVLGFTSNKGSIDDLDWD